MLDGINIDDVGSFQKNLIEVSENPLLRPCEIKGVSNIPALSNEELTAKICYLEAHVEFLAERIKNLELMPLITPFGTLPFGGLKGGKMPSSFADIDNNPFNPKWEIQNA